MKCVCILHVTKKSIADTFIMVDYTALSKSKREVDLLLFLKSLILPVTVHSLFTVMFPFSE